MITDVIEVRRAKQGITDCMDHDVGIGMSDSAFGMIDLSSADPKIFAVLKLMHIEAESNSHTLRVGDAKKKEKRMKSFIRRAILSTGNFLLQLAVVFVVFTLQSVEVESECKTKRVRQRITLNSWNQIREVKSEY